MLVSPWNSPYKFLMVFTHPRRPKIPLGVEQMISVKSLQHELKDV